MAAEEFGDALYAELQRSKEARTHVEKQIETGREALEDLRTLLDQARAVKTKGELLLGQFPSNMTSSVTTGITQLNQPLNLSDLKERAEEGVSSLESWRDEALTEMKQASDEIRETLEDLSSSFREAATEELGKVTDMMTGLAEEYEERAEAFSERVEELQESSVEMLEEHFMKALPDGVKEQGEALVDGVKALKENGVDQINKLTSAVGVIQDKAKVLLDAVEAVKPVLEVARQIM